MIKYCLNKIKPYNWIQYENICFHGYIIIDNEFYRGIDAVHFLRDHFAEKDFKEVISRINGSFALIYDDSDKVYFGVDRLRTFPLFWSVANGNLIVGDDGNEIVSNMERVELNECRIDEYLSSELFVPWNNTLIDDFYQLKAGEMAIFDKNLSNVSIDEYFHYYHDEDYSKFSEDEMISLFWEAYEKASKNMIQALAGRTAVIPLSGGADSRMILRMLKMNDYEKVICFTYGQEGNSEVEISRRVAKEFGYLWYVVPYSRKMWKELRTDRTIHDYEEMAFNYCASPHLGDFPAVCYLKSNGILPSDSVFIPGHSGDLVAGSHIREEYLNDSFSYIEFIDSINSKFFPGRTLGKDGRKRLEAYFDFAKNYDNHRLASEAEWFNMQERQAKFIINSVRIYEFFGFEWLVPLWDKEIIDFWRHIPLEYRYNRKLYFKAVKDSLPSTNDMSTKKRIAAIVRKTPGLNTIVRRLRRVKSYFKSPFGISNYIPLHKYLLACIIEHPTMEIYTLTSIMYVNKLRERLGLHE